MNVMELVASIILDTSGYESGLKNAEQSTHSFSDEISSASSESKGFEDALSAASGSLAGFMAKAVSIGTVAKIADWMIDTARETGKLGDTIAESSQKLGISSYAYQEWSYILERCGTSISTMNPLMRTMTSRIEKGSDAFKELGISAQDLENLSLEQIFDKTVEGLMGVEDATHRAALAQELFGRSYMELNPLLNSGADGLKDLKQEFESLNAVMSPEQLAACEAYASSVTRVGKAWEGIKNTIGTAILPILTEVNNQMATFMTWIATPTDPFEDATKQLAYFQDQLSKATNAGQRNYYEQQVAMAQAYVDSFSTAMQESADAVSDAEAQKAETLEQSTEDIEAALEEQQEIYEKTYDSMRKTVEGFFGTFERAGGIVRKSISQMTSNIQSQISFNQKYTESMQTISDYANRTGTDLSGVAAAIAAMGKDGAGYALALSDAINAGDTGKIENLVSQFSLLKDSQAKLTGVLTEASLAWGTIGEAAAPAQEAVQQIEKSFTQTASALESIETSAGSAANALATFPDVASQATEGTAAAFDSMTATVQADCAAIIAAFESCKRPPIYNYVYTVHEDIYDGGGGTGHAGGLAYVPYDNYSAILHEGERVLTKEEAAAYDAGLTGGGVTINQTIMSVPQTPAQLAAASAAYMEQAMWEL